MNKVYPVVVLVLLAALIYEVRQKQALTMSPLRPRPDSSLPGRAVASTPDQRALLERIESLTEENRRLRLQGGNAGPSTGITAKAAALRAILARLPEQNIPELRLATEADWITAADQDLDSTEGLRKALAHLRSAAEKRFAAKLQPALFAYLRANSGAFPRNIAELEPFVHEPIADIAARYRIVPATDYPNMDMGGDWAITQVNLIDTAYDLRLVIGPHGFGAFNGP